MRPSHWTAAARAHVLVLAPGLGPAPAPSPPARARALTLAQAVPRSVAPRALLPPAVYLPRPRTLPIQMTPTGRVCRHPRAEGSAHRLRAMFPARRRQQPVSQRAASICASKKQPLTIHLDRSASGHKNWQLTRVRFCLGVRRAAMGTTCSAA